MKLDQKYWDNKYRLGQNGWDIGYVSTPLREYFDQLDSREINILVPGAGNGHEVEYLFKKGFTNVFLLDFSSEAIAAFLNRFPDFPEDQIIQEDFFNHSASYDLIVEQTFFSSLPRDARQQYVYQMHKLLKADGRLMGLLFNHEFGYEQPPYGGTVEEYQRLFSARFDFIHFSTAYNSIKPRRGREIFLCLCPKH